MKRCQTCNRTYTDPNLSFCIDDGTPLTTETTEFVDDAPYRPPSAYVSPNTAVPGKRRRAWPWVLGVLGAFLLGVIALGVAAAIYVPRMLRSRQNVPVAVTPDETKRPESADTPADTSADAPAPTDEVQVLAQLTAIENDWTVANMNADKKALQRILADDYVGQGPPPAGGLQGKREYINTIQRDTVTERWEFNDMKVHLAGDRATLSGKVTFYGQGQQDSFNFTDKFVWRSGRWQATASEVNQAQ
jgi:hypothetical protein